jgi:hypothetical protein
MKKMIFLVVFLALMLSLGAVYHRIGGWKPPSNYYNGPVAVSGNLAAVTSQDGVHILDITDPANPYQLAMKYGYDFWYCDDLYFNGDYLYVLKNYSLSIVDVSVPEQAVTLGTFSLPYSGEKVVVSHARAYVTTGMLGLHILDVSDPQTPLLLGTFGRLTDMRDVVVSNNIAYIAAHTDGLKILDVSVPQNPVLLGSLDTPYNALDVTLHGSVLYLADWNSLLAIDISDPTTPVLLGGIDTPGNAQEVRVAGNIAWVADGEYGICGIDISDPENMAYIASYEALSICREVEVSGGLVYTENSYFGLIVLDVSDPACPGHVASQSGLSTASMVCVEGDLAYVANVRFHPGLRIYDVVNHRPPLLLGVIGDSFEVQCVRVRGGIAYCASGTGGIRIYDVADPSDPTLLGHLPTNPACASWILIEGDLAYLYGKDMGLWVVNIANPSAPVLVGSYPSPSGMYDFLFAKNGNYIYVPLEGDGLRIFDVSNPQAPEVEGFILLEPEVKSVAVAGNILYAACGEGGLKVLDISDPVLPSVVTTIIPHPSSYIERVAIEDGELYVADNGWNEILVYSLADPASPAQINSFQWNLLTEYLAFEDGHVITANDLFGMNILNLDPVAADDPQAPPPATALACHPNPFKPGATLTLELGSVLKGQAELRFYNLRGQEVREFSFSVDGSGTCELPWDGCDLQGEALPSGIYCYKLSLGGRTFAGRMTLLR